MNKRIAIIFLISSVLFFYACQKNIDIFVPNPGQQNSPDTAWYNTITTAMQLPALQNNLANVPFNDSFIISNNAVTLNTTSGVQCTFPANCCVNSNGQLLTGKINVQTLLIKNKGGMILMNKPTSSNGRMLVSGGEVFIGLSKDGQPVQLAPGVKIMLRYTDTSYNTQMKLFIGDESNATQFNWLPNTDSANNSLSINSQAYQIYTNHLRWVNCDYFFDTTGIALSTVSALLPYNYTNANTSVFLVFNDLRTVLNLNAEVANKKFTSAKVPNGKAATLVVISKQANDYYLGKTVFTTGTNASASNQAVNVTSVKASLADIKTYLNSL